MLLSNLRVKLVFKEVLRTKPWKDAISRIFLLYVVINVAQLHLSTRYHAWIFLKISSVQCSKTTNSLDSMIISHCRYGETGNLTMKLQYVPPDPELSPHSPDFSFDSLELATPNDYGELFLYLSPSCHHTLRITMSMTEMLAQVSLLYLDNIVRALLHTIALNCQE